VKAFASYAFCFVHLISIVKPCYQVEIVACLVCLSVVCSFVCFTWYWPVYLAIVECSAGISLSVNRLAFNTFTQQNSCIHRCSLPRSVHWLTSHYPHVFCILEQCISSYFMYLNIFAYNWECVRFSKEMPLYRAYTVTHHHSMLFMIAPLVIGYSLLVIDMKSDYRSLSIPQSCAIVFACATKCGSWKESATLLQVEPWAPCQLGNMYILHIDNEGTYVCTYIWY